LGQGWLSSILMLVETLRFVALQLEEKYKERKAGMAKRYVREILRIALMTNRLNILTCELSIMTMCMIG
jgi:hypothetical protein